MRYLTFAAFVLLLLILLFRNNLCVFIANVFQPIGPGGMPDDLLA